MKTRRDGTLQFHRDVLRLTRVVRWLGAAAVLGAVLIGILSVLACGDDDDRTTIINPPAPALPTVECCDFHDRKDCREIRARLLQKPGAIRKLGVCFEHNRCFTDCPEP